MYILYFTAVLGAPGLYLCLSQIDPSVMIIKKSQIWKKYTYVHTYWFVYPFIVGIITVSMQGCLVQ